MGYKDRNGNIVKAATGQDRFLKYLYTSSFGRRLLKILIRPGLSITAGMFLDKKCSRFLINPFIKQNNIDMSVFIKQEYFSYNEFFTRPILPEKRAINMNKECFVSPCDSKLTVYEIREDSTFDIKHSAYTVASLLRDKKLAKKYNGGICLIFRLTVDDYHRYCYIDNGRKTKNRYIKGILHTVNPIATEHADIYKENTREYTLMRTENFGNVIQMEVGAMFVGRIKNHHRSVHTFKRGSEKGMFEFGGSTVVLLVEKDKIKLDNDIIANSKSGYETIVKMGMKIGENTTSEYEREIQGGTYGSCQERTYGGWQL